MKFDFYPSKKHHRCIYYHQIAEFDFYLFNNQKKILI